MDQWCVVLRTTRHQRKWKARNTRSFSWSFLCNMFETLQDDIPKNQNCIVCKLERCGTLHSWCGLINVGFVVGTYNWETLSATEPWKGFSCNPTSRPPSPFPFSYLQAHYQPCSYQEWIYTGARSEYLPFYGPPTVFINVHKNCINEFEVQNVTQNTF